MSGGERNVCLAKLCTLFDDEHLPEVKDGLIEVINRTRLAGFMAKDLIKGQSFFM